MVAYLFASLGLAEVLIFVAYLAPVFIVLWLWGCYRSSREIVGQLEQILLELRRDRDGIKMPPPPRPSSLLR